MSSLRIFRQTLRPVKGDRPLESVSESVLWERAEDTDAHLIFREAALHELASRGDTKVLAASDRLLCSDEVEEWFVKLRVLETLGTPMAVERLLLMCIGVDTDHLRIILSHAGRVLDRGNASKFQRFVRGILEAGVLDITGWQPLALDVLTSECHRLGVEVTGKMTALAPGGPEEKDKSESSGLPFCTVARKNNPS
ncbi:MAG: hypothetical protein ACW99U_06370 [Candidatus Thorarchaeota archaeon]|jgi:hypothetical protein